MKNIIKNKPKTKMLRRHFTMMELMVAIAILALLSGLAAANIPGYLERGRVSAAKSQVQTLNDAIMTYQMDMGSYPENLDDLVTDPGSKKWNGPYIVPAIIPEDPWGNSYQYTYPGEYGKYDVYSFGSDGVSGGEKFEADIGNWGEIQQ